MDSKNETLRQSSSFDRSKEQRHSVLQTAQAFKSLIDSTSLDETNVKNQFQTLSSLVYVRRSLRELVDKTKFKKVKLTLVEDDMFGWPRLRVQAFVSGNCVSELSVGGQSRREGVILYFKESHKGVTFELTSKQIEDRDFAERTLRGLVRVFFESVKSVLSDKESMEKKVVDALQEVVSQDQLKQSKESDLLKDFPDLFNEIKEKKVSRKNESSDPNIFVGEDFDFFSDEKK